MTRSIVAAALILTATAANAQTPYAGMQTRPIKALSEQQIADLGAGRGMGLALAAELNGYPGPSHVLGSRLIQQEADLDKQFASRTVTPESLKASTTAVAVTQGELRETHLKYHLSTAAILSHDQMQRYAALRSYGDQPMQHHHH
jgi:hypothetical protein